MNFVKRLNLDENATTTILLLITGLFFAGSLLVFNCLSQWTEARTALEAYQTSFSNSQKLAGAGAATDTEAATTLKSLQAKEIKYRNNFWMCLSITLILSSVNLMFAHDVLNMASASMANKAKAKPINSDLTMAVIEPTSDSQVIENIHFHAKLLSFQESTDVVKEKSVS